MATTSIDASGYKCTSPLNPQLIEGKCMGISGSYNQIKSEDIAFLHEAYSEVNEKMYFFNGNGYAFEKKDGIDFIPRKRRSIIDIGNDLSSSRVMSINVFNGYDFPNFIDSGNVIESGEYDSTALLYNDLRNIFGSYNQSYQVRDNLPESRNHVIISKSTIMDYYSYLYNKLHNLTMFCEINKPTRIDYEETQRTITTNKIDNIASSKEEYDEIGGAFKYLPNSDDTIVIDRGQTSSSPNIFKYEKSVTCTKKKTRIRIYFPDEDNPDEGEWKDFVSEIEKISIITEYIQKSNNVTTYCFPSSLPLSGYDYSSIRLFGIMRCQYSKSETNNIGTNTYSKNKYKFVELTNWSIRFHDPINGYCATITWEINTDSFVSKMTDADIDDGSEPVDPLDPIGYGEKETRLEERCILTLSGFVLVTKPKYNATFTLV